MAKLDEIKARWAIVAEEPWKHTAGGAILDAQDRRITLLDAAEGSAVEHPYLRAETAKAIAAAPDDVAWLLGEVERLTKALARRRISGLWPEAEDRSGLSVWYDGGEKVVAASAEDALAVWAEFNGCKPEEHDDFSHFERVPGERNITINMGEEGAGPPVTLPAETWALLNGRGWLCTENF